MKIGRADEAIPKLEAALREFLVDEPAPVGSRFSI